MLVKAAAFSLREVRHAPVEKPSGKLGRRMPGDFGLAMGKSHCPAKVNDCYDRCCYAFGVSSGSLAPLVMRRPALPGSEHARA
jgi:hypothetical protein